MNDNSNTFIILYKDITGNFSRRKIRIDFGICDEFFGGYCFLHDDYRVFFFSRILCVWNSKEIQDCKDENEISNFKVFFVERFERKNKIDIELAIKNANSTLLSKFTPRNHLNNEKSCFSNIRYSTFANENISPTRYETSINNDKPTKVKTINEVPTYYDDSWQ